LRFSIEVTFREMHDHLGGETQRQWSDKAIAGTTPYLLGLFSIVILLASRLDCRARVQFAASAWDHMSCRPLPTASPRYDGRSEGSSVSS
jgi:hypothetical protein